MQSNPAKALAARAVAASMGGLLLYCSLPEQWAWVGWWSHVAAVPFIACVVLLTFSVVAPTRWCEFVISWL